MKTGQTQPNTGKVRKSHKGPKIINVRRFDQLNMISTGGRPKKLCDPNKNCVAVRINI